MIKRLLFQNFTLAHRLGAGFNRRLSPLGHIALFIWAMAGVFGLDTRAAATYQLFALLSALFGLCLLWRLAARRKPPGILAERRLPRHATVGEPLRYSVVLTHAGQGAQRGLSIQDRLSGSALAWAEFSATVDLTETRQNPFDRYVGYYKWRRLVHAKRGARIEEQPLPDLPANQAITLDLSLVPLRRGRLQFEGIEVYRPDPFGLTRTLNLVALPQSCCVLPKRYPVAPLPPCDGRIYQRGGVALANTVGESEEFMSLREYRPGDPLRGVHWRSSAKFGHWLVKEFRDEYFARRALVLDTFCGPERRADFEAAVSTAASLAAAEGQQDTLLDLIFVEREAHCFTIGRGLAHAVSLLEVLAGVQPSQEGDFQVLAETVLAKAGSLSGAACVFLDLDPMRRRFCEALARHRIAVDVWVVGEAAPDALSASGLGLRHIRPSRLAEDLRRC